jgi:hypothetical protein
MFYAMLVMSLAFLFAGALADRPAFVVMAGIFFLFSSVHDESNMVTSVSFFGLGPLLIVTSLERMKNESRSDQQ